VYLAKPGEGACSPCGLAYGEHPNIEPALTLAELDCSLGGQPYEEVYGKITPHYLSGSAKASSSLDRWILVGRSFDISWDRDAYLFVGEYYHKHKPTTEKIRGGSTLQSPLELVDPGLSTILAVFGLE